MKTDLKMDQTIQSKTDKSLFDFNPNELVPFYDSIDMKKSKTSFGAKSQKSLIRKLKNNSKVDLTHTSKANPLYDDHNVTELLSSSSHMINLKFDHLKGEQHQANMVSQKLLSGSKEAQEYGITTKTEMIVGSGCKSNPNIRLSD